MINFAYGLPLEMAKDFSDFMHDRAGNSSDPNYIFRFVRTETTREDYLTASEQTQVEIDTSQKMPDVFSITDYVFNNPIVDGVQYFSVNEYCQNISILRMAINALESYVASSSITNRDIVWIGAWEMDGIPVGVDYAYDFQRCSYEILDGSGNTDTKTARLDWSFQGTPLIPFRDEVLKAFVPTDRENIRINSVQLPRCFSNTEYKPTGYSTDGLTGIEDKPSKTKDKHKTLNISGEVLGQVPTSSELIALNSATQPETQPVRD